MGWDSLFAWWRGPAPAADGRGEQGGGNNERVVVVGGGVVGSACAYSLARRGVSVRLIDAGEPFGSSWGESRLARLSQSSPLLLRLMTRAKTLWDQLSEDAGGRLLLKQCGMVDLGDAESLRPVLQTYEAEGTPYELLSPAELTARYPGMRLGAGQQALLQRDGWLTLAQECVTALREQAERFGAAVEGNDAVVSIDTARRVVSTAEGAAHHYDRLVLCCGPWTNAVLRSAGLGMLPLVVTCEQQTYFLPQPGREADYDWDRMPIWIDRQDPAYVYGVPHVPGGCQGLKVASHHAGQVLVSEDHPVPPGFDPVAAGERLAAPAYRGRRGSVGELPGVENTQITAQVSRWVSAHCPGLRAAPPAFYYRCMYTTAADGEFVVGAHPEGDGRVFLAAAFGGEGFKFATAVGEAVADAALGAPERVEGLRARADPARLLARST